MSQKIISYDLKTKNFALLNEKDKKEYIDNILAELQNSIINYVTQKLSEQEIYLFNFPESNALLNNKNLFYTTIKKLIEDIKNSENYSYVQYHIPKFKDKDKGELELGYEEICGIVNFIIFIFDNSKKDKKDVLYNFSIDGILPHIQFEIKKIQFSKLIEDANFIKKINICLSNKNCKNVAEMKEKYVIDIKVIQLFCLFFKAFFHNILMLTIDLNIYEINRFFNIEINPYHINEEQIIKYGNIFANIFLGNFIIMKKLTKLETLSKVCFKIYDSYQIELHSLMTKYFSVNNDENNNKNNSRKKTSSSINIINNDEINKFSDIYQNKLLYFQHILPKIGTEFYDVNIEFNSLDPLLFSYVNILLIRYACLANISIIFFDFNKVSYRKILINSYYYNFYSDGKKNPFTPKYCPEKTNAKYDNDYKIFYNHINNINDNKNKELLLLRDEVILNELFPYFNYNLNALLIIIENKIKDESNPINSLSLNFCSSNIGYTNINIYDNYNTAIICFIYNFLNILETNKNICGLSSLDLWIDDFNGEKEFIIRKIKKKNPFNKESKVFNIKDIKQLSHLSFNISNISLFIPFENFPMKSLTELIIENITYTDLDNLINCLKKDKNIFNKLINLEIGLKLMAEDFRKNVEFLLKDCFLPGIRNFKLKISNNITYEDIANIIVWIKENKNNKAIYFLKISNNKLSPSIGTTYFQQMVKEFNNSSKKIFHNNNIITDIKTTENKNISLSIKLLDDKNINYYLKFIDFFNKVLYKNEIKAQNKDKNKKIFENIFYYMGIFRKSNKELKIEIF